MHAASADAAKAILACTEVKALHSIDSSSTRHEHMTAQVSANFSVNTELLAQYNADAATASGRQRE